VKILLSVDPSQLGFIGRLEDPSEAWQTLETIHRSSSVNSVLSLHRHFFTMKKLPPESILTWIGRVHTCALELSLTTAPVTDLDIILIISEGLPPEYAPTVTTFDNLPISELTLDLVRTRLMSMEAQMKRTTQREDGAFSDLAMVAANSSAQSRGRGRHVGQVRKDLTCYTCGGRGHIAAVCPSPQDRAHIMEEEAKDDSALLLHTMDTFSDTDIIHLF